MAQITGGFARVMQRKQIRDYEPRECEARLDFTVGEGEDFAKLFDLAAALASQKVDQLLAKWQIACEFTSTPAAEPVVARGRGRPPGAPNKPRAPEPTPAAPVEEAQVEETQAAEPLLAAPSPETVDLDDVLTAAAPEVTDAQVKEHVAKQAQKMVGQADGIARIKKLIYEFVGGPPHTASEIPQAQRAAFIAKLEAL